jgi:hypothetical protein
VLLRRLELRLRLDWLLLHSKEWLVLRDKTKGIGHQKVIGLLIILVFT